MDCKKVFKPAELWSPVAPATASMNSVGSRTCAECIDFLQAES